MCDIASNLVQDLPSLPLQVHPSLIATVTHLFREWLPDYDEDMERKIDSLGNRQKQPKNKNDDNDEIYNGNGNNGNNGNQRQTLPKNNSRNNVENSGNQRIQVSNRNPAPQGHPNDYSSKYGMTGLPQTTTNGSSGYYYGVMDDRDQRNDRYGGERDRERGNGNANGRGRDERNTGNASMSMDGRNGGRTSQKDRGRDRMDMSDSGAGNGGGGGRDDRRMPQDEYQYRGDDDRDRQRGGRGTVPGGRNDEREMYNDNRQRVEYRQSDNAGGGRQGQVQGRVGGGGAGGGGGGGDRYQDMSNPPQGHTIATIGGFQVRREGIPSVGAAGKQTITKALNKATTNNQRNNNGSNGNGGGGGGGGRKGGQQVSLRDDMRDYSRYDSDDDDIGEEWRDFADGVIEDHSQFISKGPKGAGKGGAGLGKDGGQGQGQGQRGPGQGYKKNRSKKVSY